MVFVLPPFNETVDNKDQRKTKIYENNIQYEPIYNNIYNIDPKIVDTTGESIREKEKNIFNLPLSVILKNMANTLLLILKDLTNIENYSNVKNFLKIFMIENRLLYFGIFVILLSLYSMLFFHHGK